MSWNYDGFWPAGQANISVLLGKLTRYTNQAAIWTTNSSGTFDGDRMTVWAYYKFYTRGGAFKTIYGGDDDAWVQVHHANANGDVTDPTAVLNHYHHKHSRTFTGDLTLSEGWYRVFVQAYNKDENSFNSNPGWVGLRILRWL